MDTPGLKEIIERHRARLLGIRGVIGIGAGVSATDPQRSCILVFADRDQWPDELPRELDGYPVELHLASEFKAL